MVVHGETKQQAVTSNGPGVAVYCPSMVQVTQHDDHQGGPHRDPSSSANSPSVLFQRKESQRSEIRYPALHVLRALMAVAVFASHWSVPRYAMFIPQIQLPVD